MRRRSPEHHALAALDAARRRRRVADVDLFDAFYSAYLTGIGIGAVMIVGITIVPDAQVATGTALRIADVGGAWIGLVLALVVAVGCRSGGRGGPLALEAPVVQHVLLAPLSRSLTLRGPAWKQLRFAGAVGSVAGGVCGLLAARRLPGGVISFLASGAVAGGLVAVATVGAALVLSGRRVPMRAANAAAVTVLGLSVVDLVVGLRVSPLTHLGLLALAPLGSSPLVVIGPALALAVVAAGVAGVGGTSIEAAERRAGLVGQLRFAVTLQDLRTVVLLRRQLAQEHARHKPWLRLGRPRLADRAPVAWRSVQGIVRFPVARLARMAVLGVVAGVAMRGVWAGTTPLIVVAALALFVAGLDAIEPLSQEVDRPDRWASFPRREGSVLVEHLPAPVLVMGVVGLLAVGSAAALGPGTLVVELGLAVVPGVAVAAVVGAAGSVVMGPPDLFKMALPEAAGFGMVVRAVWPPGLIALALAPVAVARATTTASAVATAVNLEVLLVFPLLMVGGWLATRKARLS